MRKPDYKSYKEFLQSPVWRTIKMLVRQRSHGTCEYCYIRPADAVHHRYYKPGYQFGWGKEDLRDLMHCCKTCHDAIHGKVQAAIYVSVHSPAYRGDSGLSTANDIPGHWMLGNAAYIQWINFVLPQIPQTYGVHLERQV